MARVRDEDIALVRDRTSIADVISETVTLKSAGGGNLKGLCPFHDEKTPSFTVSPARNVYFCHGCGAGGDAIKFLMDADHLTFIESVERLAGKAGIQLRYDETPAAGGRSVPRQQPGQKQRLIAAHVAAAQFYREQLTTPGARKAREFLAQRGFGRDAAERYGCGFAPEGWDPLVKHLRQKGFTHEELTTAGLAKPARSGSLIDRFRRRLIWPIRDLAGDVIGFGARKLFDDDDGPKYLNTPESPLYKKSHVLYGLDHAKREIAKQGRAVIVEGYTDVMACHEAGVPTAVATCGTAFGADHIGVLRRLLLDSDDVAGAMIYTFDGYELDLENGVSVTAPGPGPATVPVLAWATSAGRCPTRSRRTGGCSRGSGRSCSRPRAHPRRLPQREECACRGDGAGPRGRERALRCHRPG